MKQTRSIEYGRHGGVELVERPIHDPGPGQVQVQTLACGICSWDIHVYKNGSPWRIMPGHEGIARVTKLGKDVAHLTEGMRVTGHGLGFTEVDTLPADQLYPLPDNGLADDHLLVEPASCVVTGLDHCHLQAGHRVAVVGCGFMGLMMVQALARTLVERIVAVDIAKPRLDLARQFGATETLQAGSDGFDQRIDALKHEAIDTVIDCTGTQAGLDIASRTVRTGGRLILFGWNHGQAHFPGDVWHMQGITVVNATPAAKMRDPFPPAISLLTRGVLDLKPLVTHVVPLDCYGDLLARIAAGESGYIKGVVRLAANGSAALPGLVR